MANNGSPQMEEAFKIRSYQLEMLEESLKRNIIVAMETGAGKTFVAILRIQAELDQCSPEKLCWVLCPTVELAFQQHAVINNSMPAFQTRVLSGADNVEYWSNQSIWDDVLRDIRIVVSTHQILLHALSHGFVKMTQLALMVFDEAHSCIGNHPSNRILREFYHKCIVKERPGVLGLSASPVINSKVGNLGTIETNLNAISRTPRLHRDELLLHVYPPKLIPLTYPTIKPERKTSSILEGLWEVCQNLDIEQDPWIVKMRSNPTQRNAKALIKAIMSRNTYSHVQIKGLYDKALNVYAELGSSAADYFIAQCVKKFQKGMVERSNTVGVLESEERLYIGQKLSGITLSQEVDNHLPNGLDVSPKVQKLITFLNEEASTDFSGLVFVRTRAEVAVLHYLLSLQVPWLQVSTFVGASSFAGQKAALSELAELKNQRTTLTDLRQGRKNLVVTTNALEEGIDVSRCKMVICFDRPPNLKSFIQRRGRARKSDSKFVIMFEDGSPSDVITVWTGLEAQMRDIYMDEMRQLKEIQDEEDLFEGIHPEQRPLFVKSTGAKLTLDDAISHLYHFCDTLPAESYVDRSPIFSFQDNPSGAGRSSITATVSLPNSVDASLRQACGDFRWRTERMAKRDAAFKAYKALYEAGLVDDHLLPLGHVDEAVNAAYSAVEKSLSLVEVAAQLDPWLSVARKWSVSKEIHGSIVSVRDGDMMCAEMMMLVPQRVPNDIKFDLYWDAEVKLKALVKPSTKHMNAAEISSARLTTIMLLQTAFAGRMAADKDDFVALFAPCNTADLEAWVKDFSGAVEAETALNTGIGENLGLVRDLSHGGVPHVFRGFLCISAETLLDETSMDVDGGESYEEDCREGLNSETSIVSDQYKTIRKPSYAQKMPSRDPYRRNKPHKNVIGGASSIGIEDSSEGKLFLKVNKLPKRIDFLHHSPAQDLKIARGSRPKRLPAECCEVDRLPFRYSQFAMFIPSVLHRIQVTMVVNHLCEDILAPLHFKDRCLVSTAITSSSANEGVDYERLEFFGDSILKYMTSLALMAGHLNWHEGILSHMKDHIVSNSSLASAALKAGLDKYILTKPFTGRKWRPLYNSSILQNQHESKREMSSKTLADVVEALVGAAYLDGGPQKALVCLSIFLPNVSWIAPPEACRKLYAVHDLQASSSSSPLANVERLLDHQFRCKALLVEALTHGSHRGPSSGSSYQRLEFLGDAILDNIVTRTAFSRDPPIPTPRLHLIRTALVNGNYLGFLCLGLCVMQTRKDPVTEDPDNISTREVVHPLYLWQAMRHTSPTVSTAQKECVLRYQAVHNIIEALCNHGNRYPWRALAHLEPPKPMSDIVESLLGAIYIDTQGSLPACETFLERLGLMTYLRRVIHEDIALLHPKEELGQLADRDTVRYDLFKAGDEKQQLMCRVLVGEKKIVTVKDGLSVMEIQTRAADEACTALKGEVRAVHTRAERQADLGFESEGGGKQGRESEDEAGRESDSDIYVTADE